MKKSWNHSFFKTRHNSETTDDETTDQSTITERNIESNDLLKLNIRLHSQHYPAFQIF